ncbi:MAG: hypothetical protein JWM85_912, partial [Acidimicrobiaceae bacterium]|nr:hypothetical protein [Acidimicrobiaceae bacterium]
MMPTYFQAALVAPQILAATAKKSSGGSTVFL